MPMTKPTWIFAIILNGLILGLGVRAELPPYTLKSIENADYLDHDRAETLDQLSVSRWDMRSYRCDGVQEFVLLPELQFRNRRGNSLWIQTYQSKQLALYRGGELYREDTKTKAGDDLRKDRFITHVLRALAKLEAIPSGKAMLERLEHSPYPITIRYGSLPHFWAEDYAERPLHGMLMAQAIQLLNTLRWPEYGDEFDQIGAGGEIKFTPVLDNTLFIEDDDQERPAQPHIILAHEMMHAFDGIRGLLDRREMNGEAYEFIEVTEYRATYFENQIRHESGLHYRKFYGDRSHGGLLGKDGKPILVPAPCVGKDF